MSNDTYHHNLWNAIGKEGRDKYTQQVIGFLDDPDYDGVPIVLDPVTSNMMVPQDMPITAVRRVLEWALKLLEGKDDE